MVAVVSTAVLSHRHRRPGPVALAALVVWALLFAALGAVVVEPTLHRLMAAQPTRTEARHETTRPLPPPPINDIVLDGAYATEGLTLRADGAALTFGTARIVTAPHRLALAAEPAAQGVSFATALDVAANVQIEIRRIEAGTAPLCAGGETGWLAMAVRADGVSLLPLRTGDPPGATRSPAALCPVRVLGRR
jgi:hypothetical protein